MRQRRKFTREFKVEAVRLSRQPGRSVGEVAKVCCGGGGTNSRRRGTRHSRGPGSRPAWRKRIASCGPRSIGCGWSVRFFGPREPVRVHRSVLQARMTTLGLGRCVPARL